MNKVLMFSGAVLVFGLIYPPFFGFVFGAGMVMGCVFLLSKIL